MSATVTESNPRSRKSRRATSEISLRVRSFFRSRSPDSATVVVGLGMCRSVLLQYFYSDCKFPAEGSRKDTNMNSSPTNNLPDDPDGIRVAVPFAAIVLAMLPAVLDQTILA